MSTATPSGSASTSPLHPIILRAFTAAFGTANHVVGKDMHWGLVPQPGRAAIHVLVNGSSALPVVWVFDPHAPFDQAPQSGVHHQAIAHESDIAPLVALILARVENGKRG
jgi:hypothetical protein